MKNKIEKFLKEYDLLDENRTLIVGFSGGFDSISLLNILKELSNSHTFRLIACHLNHNWRAEESKQEAKNCENFCKKNGIEFYVETLDATEKHTETRARELRYQFFNRVIEKFSADGLLTAHTKSDTAETLIYRLIKGTGIHGLKGISPKLGKIYRPMLDISRKEVENYCQQNNLKPNNDSSNADNKYSRNFIRNKILPLFSKINNEYEEAVNSLSKLAIEDEEIVCEYLKKLNIINENKIATNIFKKQSYAVQKRTIYDYFAKNNIEYSEEKIVNALKFVNENITSKSGKKHSLNSTQWLFVNIEIIEIITKSDKNEDIIEISKCGEYEFGSYIFSIQECTTLPEKFPQDKEMCSFVDLTDIKNLTIRTRRNGDIIQPLGSKSTTKLKKYLMNKNIAQHLKDSLILLCTNNEVLWVGGIGLSEKIKVVKNCTHVITLKKKD